jgi:hypothetical protein
VGRRRVLVKASTLPVRLEDTNEFEKVRRIRLEGELEEYRQRLRGRSYAPGSRGGWLSAKHTG